MYTVLFSKDPYLLARMAVDLQMEGFAFDDLWNDVWHPFDRRFPPIDYMLIGGSDGVKFHCHNCEGRNPVRLHLTENNYLQMLGLLIDNKMK